MRKLWLVLVVNVLVFGIVGAGLAQAKLDPSFGRNGVVPVQLPGQGPPGYESVLAMAAARSGTAFVLTRSTSCPANAQCTTGRRLYRYAPDGVRDSAFGGPAGFYELPFEEGEAGLLATDSQGRPLVGQASAGRLVIRRVTTTGSLDGGFGLDGAAAFECDCAARNARLVPGAAGTLSVVLPGTGEGFGHKGTPITVFRLKADGLPDPSFGSQGRAKLSLAISESLVVTAAVPGGGLYLAGSGCCAASPPLGLVRVSAKGRFDKRFAKATRHSLGSVKRLHGKQIRIGAVLVRSAGTIELLGSTGYEKRGFQLRLNPDGTLHRKFGKQGLRMLPEPVSNGALGSEGATLGLSSNGLTNKAFLARILSSGKIDRSFNPEAISGLTAQYGVDIVPVTGRKVLVLDPGIEDCRSYCVPRPQLIRLLEGPPRKRR